MNWWVHAFSQKNISNYCLAAWIPDILMEQKIREVQDILWWGHIDMSHSTLMEKLNYLPRFTANAAIDEGSRVVVFQDYVWPHQIRVREVSRWQRSQHWNWHKGYPEELDFMTEYHDSVEAISTLGDIHTPLKLKFSREIKILHDAYEKRLIDILCQSILSPEETGFSREEMSTLLHESDGKKTLRSQLWSHDDKIEAANSVLHEILEWDNFTFETTAKNYTEILWEIASWKKLPLVEEHPIMEGVLWAKNVQDELLKVLDKWSSKNVRLQLNWYEQWKEIVQEIPELTFANDTMSGADSLVKRRKIVV